MNPINKHYSLTDYFDYSNLINAFIPGIEIEMIKTNWRKQISKYTLLEHEIHSPETPTYIVHTFQQGDENIFSFRNGLGCEPDDITEQMVEIVEKEFKISGSTTSLFLTFVDFYNSATANISRVEINIACNDSDGFFAGEMHSLTIDDDILEMDCNNPADIKFINSRLIIENRIQIPAKLKGTCVGNVFWNTYEILTTEAVKLINFLLEINWSVGSAEAGLYDALKNGDITEQDLEQAFEV
jgi:hypothetical protein